MTHNDEMEARLESVKKFIQVILGCTVIAVVFLLYYGPK